MTKTRSLIVALSSLSLSLGLGLYCLSAAQDPAATTVSKPDSAAPRPTPKTAAPDRTARRAPGVPPKDARVDAARAARVEAARAARAEAGPAARDKVARKRVEQWMEAAQKHDGDNRAAVLEQHLEALVERGAASVYELETRLENTSVHREAERHAVFHALARVGVALLETPNAESDNALASIHRLAQRELELPEYVVPDPELRVEELSERERHALLHARRLVEVDGRLAQPTAMNKLAAVQMLGDLADEESMLQLDALADGDFPVGVKLAAEHLSLGSAE